MSDFTAVRAVTETLFGILQAGITNSADPELQGVPIDLRSPKEMREANGVTGVSLWLYRITRDADSLNLPPERILPINTEGPLCRSIFITWLLPLSQSRKTGKR